MIIKTQEKNDICYPLFFHESFRFCEKMMDFHSVWLIFIDQTKFQRAPDPWKSTQINENPSFFHKIKKIHEKKEDTRCQILFPSFFDHLLALCQKWNRPKVLSRSWRKTVAPGWRGPIYPRRCITFLESNIFMLFTTMTLSCSCTHDTVGAATEGYAGQPDQIWTRYR